jgi:hypothetical protein
MALSPKGNAILLQLLHLFIQSPHIALSITFPQMLQHFTHTSAVWMTQTKHFALKKVKRSNGQSILNMLFRFIKCSWF